VKCSENHSNCVSNTIRGYIHHMKCAVYMAFFFTFLHVFWFSSYHYIYIYIYSCMFVHFFNSVRCVFLLLCVFCSVYSVFIVPTGTLPLP